MNKIFRIVFNTTTGRWVVASEMAKGRTKGNATRIGASLLGLSGLAVISPSAFAGDFIMCNGGTQTALIARGTGDFLPGLTCTPTSTGIVMSDSTDGSLPVASDAYITIGNNIASPTATAAGALTLNGPNGIRLQGATTTTGLATFQNGANLFNTKIMSLAAGNLAAGSTDAVNGGQLFTTNQNVAANAANIATLQTSVGLVQQDATSRTISVGSGTNGALVDFTGTAGVRKLTGVSAGTLSATSTDAVDGAQLDATNQNVATNATNITALGGRVTTTEGNITNLQTTVNNISSGTAGLVQQDATTRTISVAKGNNGTLVDFAGTAGARKLTGVSAGTLSGTSTDAVNGAQLNATDQNVTALGGRVTTAEGNITNVTNRVTTVEGNVANLTTQINHGSIGLVQQAAAGSKLTVGASTDGGEVNFANNANRARKLTRVAAGTGSEDAVNVSQLKSVTDGLGGGASIDPVTGLVTGPTYAMTNADGSQSPVHSVGDAVTNLDGRVHGNTTRINSLTSQISSGTVGMVQQAGAGQKLTVGKDTDGSEVSFANAAGAARKLSGVAAGTVSATSTDAVNGSQLHGVSQSVATALGGGASVNADGTISAPTYTVTNADGTTAKVSGVEGAIGNLDGRVHDNTARIGNVESSVSNLSSKIDSGAVGLVQQAAPGEQLTVGKSTDGSSVNVAGTAGDRVLAGVAAGKADNEAVNVGQLKTAGVIGENGEVKAVLGYDSVDKGSVTLGGAGAANPVALHNVAAGVSDADAVNVSQLNARLQAQSNSVMAQANAYADDRFKSAINEIDSLRTDVDDRFQVQDKRIDRLGAMSSAMTSMASSMSGVNRVNRVGVGAGDSNGRLAMAVGYQRAFRDSGATLTAGASFTDEDSTIGVGAGFGW
jgi:autotransporter adhesin